MDAIPRRRFALAIVVAATLVLLVGTRALIGGTSSRASVPPGGSVVALASPTGTPSAGPPGSGSPTIVLIGAGDIADCTLTGAAQTSDLLTRETGSIFT